MKQTANFSFVSTLMLLMQAIMIEFEKFRQQKKQQGVNDPEAIKNNVLSDHVMS